DDQSERLAANQIRKLRLPDMQNFFLGAVGMLDQVTKQACSPSPVAPYTRGRTLAATASTRANRHQCWTRPPACSGATVGRAYGRHRRRERSEGTHRNSG